MMRFPFLATVALGLAVTGCQSSATQSPTTTTTYPGSHIDARGYRVDAGSYYVPPPEGGPVAPPTAPLPARRTGTVAWTDNGYSYDAWGNLLSGPGVQR